MPIVSTACPRNCYSTCSLLVHVEDGRIRRIEPHPANLATPRGACLKGLSYVERSRSPDRLLHPLRRRPGTDTFERIGWDDALDLIAARLRGFRDAHGPRSVLYLTGSGTKGLLNRTGAAFWRLYGGCTTTYGDLCWPAGLEATRLTLGENKHSAPWDIANARLIVMWGKNAAETNLHQMPFVYDALGRGARLVVVDPRRTETSDRADLLIQPRPGTDAALALAVANLLIARGHVDRAFITRHVLGFEAFAARASAWTPARAAAVAGVPAARIEQLAEWFGTLPPVTLCAGFGMQRYSNSGQTMRTLLALLAITGNLGRPGAGWVYANLQSHIFDEVKDPLAFFPPEHPDGVTRVSVSLARLGEDMLAQRDPPLRMAWVERGNPLTQNPDTRTVRRAFRALEFRVVVDPFLTDTAREADLVLPGKELFEQTDVIGAYWHPYLQLLQKVLDPPGEVKPESEIWWHLARRLGVSECDLEEHIPAPTDAAVEAWLAHRLARAGGPALEPLRAGPALPPGHQEVAFSDLRFATPSGRIELWSDEAARRWGVDPLPDHVEPVEATGGDAAAAARYPLVFMTPNTKNRIHSQFGNLAMIRALDERPAVSLHPADAAARGIRDGDRVGVFNGRGRLEVEARLDHGLRPGCACMTNGWWSAEGGPVNLCSLGRETDMGHGAAFHENRVEIARVAGVPEGR